MKRLLTLLLTLAAGAAILLGFTLPWLVTGWQDRQTQGELLRYEAPQVRLDAGADLFQRLGLLAGEHALVSLSNPSTQRTAQQVQEQAQEAMARLTEYDLGGTGLAVFAPDRWSPLSIRPYLATAQAYDDVETGVVHIQNAVLVWQCVFSTQKGEQLTLLMDDDLGLMLSFTYSYPIDAKESADLSVSVDLSQGLADLLTGFCREYYQLSSAQALAVSNGSWQLLLVNAASEKLTVSLSATAAGDLLFNAQEN